MPLNAPLRAARSIGPLLPFVAAWSLCCPSAHAFDFAGTKRIVAHTRDGRDIAISTVSFKPKDDAAGGAKNAPIAYTLDMDMRPFNEFFLSMRQFKCLEGPDITCYVPYPYTNPHTVTATDLSWLEHDLLFFWKAPNDYGAKLGNGLIYGLQPAGAALVGKPEAIDLDRIASPPADLSVPPYPRADRDEIADGARYIDGLRIE